MERETDIFDSAVRGQDDLDVDLANAGIILQKLAEEQGIDINALSDEDVAGLLTDLLPGERNETQAEEPTKEKESSAMTTPTTPTELTVADVSIELAKIAQAEGIDLNETSREEYSEAFSALAERMKDPGYYAAKTAAAEKIAEAQMIGREMALSFIETLKQAEGEEKKEEKEEKKEEKGEAKEAGARQAFEALKGHAGRLAGAAKGHAGKAVEAAKAHKRDAVMAGGGAAAGLAAGEVHGRSKKSFDEQVEERAREILLANGFNPETGEKVAESGEAMVEAAAVELLKGKGFTFGE